ncbi:hypothetical protein GBA65_15895 [Rubrobacter marinus]|uniref:G domain-containing protein n=1 Tax=Rubrobacter marinus TaxID=2653852 RepID=A0A6G8Q016_9ACTN|nr:dynamin family protein [Rubrobacter marinus]QIN79770.1 hypothetical protein GBA65_15895 [Rubrobacter marinus]
MQTLGGRRETLVTRERALLESLIEFLTGFGAPTGDVELLRRTLADMGDPFLLVVVGEFNAGKSAFINALINEDVTAEGSLPTTDRITVLKHSHDRSAKEAPGGIVERGFPSEFLRAISIVDTPGTNAVIRHHEQLSREFVPRSDLVLFLTSAERPFSESEREYMRIIRDWGKKIILVVTKVDVLARDEKEKMREFVQEQVQTLLGLTPPVFMISSRTARKAKGSADRAERERLMGESGFDELEGYVSNLMSQKDLAQLKLQSPLGVAEELVRRYRSASGERAKLLTEDAKMVESLDSQLDAYREETRRDFEVRLGQIALVVNEINGRADAWFEANSGFRTSLFGRKGELQERFKEEVIAGTDEVVDKKVRELINWLVFRHIKQWRQIVDYIELHRNADLTRRLAGDIGDDFVVRRDALLHSISEAATNAVQSYDYKAEADRLAKSLKGAVAKTAATEAGSMGLGDPATELSGGGSLDITGTTTALLVTGVELAARPGRKAREEFRTQTSALRERLNAAVQRQLETELDAAVKGMHGTVVPYANFVQSELNRMKMAESILGKLGGGVTAIRGAVDSSSL